MPAAAQAHPVPELDVDRVRRCSGPCGCFQRHRRIESHDDHVAMRDEPDASRGRPRALLGRRRSATARRTRRRRCSITDTAPSRRLVTHSAVPAEAQLSETADRPVAIVAVTGDCRRIDRATRPAASIPRPFDGPPHCTDDPRLIHHGPGLAGSTSIDVGARVARSRSTRTIEAGAGVGRPTGCSGADGAGSRARAIEGDLGRSRSPSQGRSAGARPLAVAAGDHRQRGLRSADELGGPPVDMTRRAGQRPGLGVDVHRPRRGRSGSTTTSRRPRRRPRRWPGNRIRRDDLGRSPDRCGTAPRRDTDVTHTASSVTVEALDPVSADRRGSRSPSSVRTRPRPTARARRPDQHRTSAPATVDGDDGRGGGRTAGRRG